MAEADVNYMKQALLEAREAYSRGEVPVGAVVVCNDRIIARAHNLTETLNDPTAHAEMQAITAAASFLGGKYLKDCTIYVTLEPCIMCAGALFWSQIPEVVYGAPDPKRGYTLAGYPILNASTKVRSGILEEEASQLLKRFFAARR
ncbi:MAG: nucleoside deaminase [Bacteroidales bacterium]|nr:nucleoside deaminase [Bacteroidales bacterium]